MDASAPSASSSSSPAIIAPSIADLAATGIFKFQPLVADFALGWISGGVASEPELSAGGGSSVPAAATSASSSSAMPPAPSSGGLAVVLSFPQLLRQTLLLRHATILPQPSSEPRTESAFAHAVEQLFIHGANLSDLTNMYAQPSPPDPKAASASSSASSSASADADAASRPTRSTSLHPGMRRMSSMQPKQLDIMQVQERLGRLQRPLIFPFLLPHCIPDLARMVLEYF